MAGSVALFRDASARSSSLRQSSWNHAGVRSPEKAIPLGIRRIPMKPTLFVLAIATLFCATAVQAADWITAPSYYTHDKMSGQRVAQYSPIGPYYYYQRADFTRSGYRNYRSTIQAGGSADNFHMVEEWGK